MHYHCYQFYYIIIYFVDTGSSGLSTSVIAGIGTGVAVAIIAACIFTIIIIILTIRCCQHHRNSPNAHVALKPSLTTTRDDSEMQNALYLGHIRDHYMLEPPSHPAPNCLYPTNIDTLSAEYAQPYQYPVNSKKSYPL